VNIPKKVDLAIYYVVWLALGSGVPKRRARAFGSGSSESCACRRGDATIVFRLIIGEPIDEPQLPGHELNLWAMTREAAAR